jgi:hypothetical protein
MTRSRLGEESTLAASAARSHEKRKGLSVYLSLGADSQRVRSRTFMTKIAPENPTVDQTRTRSRAIP